MDREEFDHWDEQRRRRRSEREALRAERRTERQAEDAPRQTREGRKAKVLHTRVSEQLDESLRRAANEMRVPVSNLVRNVLEDVFDVVETVTENVEDLVEDLMGEADHVRQRFQRRRPRERRVDPQWAPTDTLSREQDREARRRAEQELREMEGQLPDPPESDAEADRDRPEFADVVGWQPLVLNADKQCADCGRDLRRGDQSFLGLGAAGATGHYLCRECLAARG